MKKVVRFGISVDEGLQQRFDEMIAEKGYVNRSEAMRDLIRNALVENQSKGGEEDVVGTVTLVFDHHVRDLSEKLTELQHLRHENIIATLHVHLDHDNCLEVLVVKGKSNEVHQLADTLISVKGVKHGKLVMTASGRDLD